MGSFSQVMFPVCITIIDNSSFLAINLPFVLNINHKWDFVDHLLFKICQASDITEKVRVEIQYGPNSKTEINRLCNLVKKKFSSRNPYFDLEKLEFATFE